MAVRKEDTKLQRDMHKNFFDETERAMENGYYLEAIFREYAAIEGRMEVILGLLGAPCNKFCDDEIRKKIDFSHRINCLKKLYIGGKVPGMTKLDKRFFEKLDKWRNDRNTIVHGYYKNELKYSQRSHENKTLSVKGLDLANKLYNEANRLKRIRRNHPETDLESVSVCFETGCTLHSKNGKQ